MQSRPCSTRARARKLIAANGSEEMIRTLVQNEEQQHRHTSLRWGIVLTSLAVGFGSIEYFGWDDVTAGRDRRAARRNGRRQPRVLLDRADPAAALAMNYVILIGLALFFVATSFVTARWDGTSARRLDELPHRRRQRTRCGSRPTARSISSPTAAVSPRSTGAGSFDVSMRRNGLDRRVLFTSPDGTIERQFFVEGDEQPWGPRPTASSPKRCRSCCARRPSTPASASRGSIASRGDDGPARRDRLDPPDFAQRVYSVEYAQTARDRGCRLRAAHDDDPDHMSSDFDVRTTLIEVFDAQMPTGTVSPLCSTPARRSPRFRRAQRCSSARPSMPRRRKRRRLSRLGGDDTAWISTCARVAAPPDGAPMSTTRSSHAPSASPATRSRRISTCARCSRKRPIAWPVGHVARHIRGRTADQQRLRSAHPLPWHGPQRRAYTDEVQMVLETARDMKPRISTPRRC